MLYKRLTSLPTTVILYIIRHTANSADVAAAVKHSLGAQIRLTVRSKERIFEFFWQFGGKGEGKYINVAIALADDFFISNATISNKLN